MTRLESEWLASLLVREGWPEARVEPSVENGYVVAYRRLPDEAYRHARRLSPSIQARYKRETRSKIAPQGDA